MSTIILLAWEFRFVIVSLIAILLFALLEWNSFKSIAYGIMLQAKSLAKDTVLKSGQEQEDWVVKKLYPYVPLVVRPLISEETLRTVVRALFLKAKDYLDDGQINNSIQ